MWTARWLLASFYGKGKVTFFLLLPFANLIRHFWAAGASLFTDECLLMHFLQMLLWMFFPAFSGKIYSCKLNSRQGKLYFNIIQSAEDPMPVPAPCSLPVAGCAPSRGPVVTLPSFPGSSSLCWNTSIAVPAHSQMTRAASPGFFQACISWETRSKAVKVRAEATHSQPELH